MKSKFIFVCRGNVARSTMAEAFFNVITNGKYQTLSAGTKVRDAEGNDKNGQLLKDCPGAFKVIDVLKECDIDVSEKARIQLKPEMLEGAEKIIVMAEKDTMPGYLVDDPRVLYWTVDDPKGTDVETHRRVMLEIQKRVKDFVAEAGLLA
jgi:arsenate reductase (thioredoxin)